MTGKSGKNSFKIVIIHALVLFSAVCRIQAQDYLAGVRGGTTFQNEAGDFQQVDVFAAKYLPWLWGFRDGLNLKPLWEASAGWLDNNGSEGFVGTTGPELELRVKEFPVTLEAGASLAAMSRYQFPDRNLGGWFEFTDHFGLNWHITKQFTFGWRYQHTSNAGIYARNPGLNLQMLSVSFRF
jgi:hypothetical protein